MVVSDLRDASLAKEGGGGDETDISEKYLERSMDGPHVWTGY